jgi:hypothetical protein
LRHQFEVWAADEEGRLESQGARLAAAISALGYERTSIAVERPILVELCGPTPLDLPARERLIRGFRRARFRLRKASLHGSLGFRHGALASGGAMSKSISRKVGTGFPKRSATNIDFRVLPGRGYSASQLC